MFAMFAMIHQVHDVLLFVDVIEIQWILSFTKKTQVIETISHVLDLLNNGTSLDLLQM